MAISIGDRHLPPTKSGIEKMMKSLEEAGQLAPIVVTHVTHNTFRIVIGATRFEAAKQLHWKKILATIANGSAADIEIAELVENIERRELTDKQRHDMRERVKELQSQQLANVEPAKGGRGKKGGLRDAARKAGMSKDTARRRKVAQNTENAPVFHSSDAPRSASATMGLVKTSISMSSSELNRLDTWRMKYQKGASRTECIRKIVREYLVEHDKQADDRAA